MSKMLGFSSSKAQGFTLIELLIVIAVLGVLIAAVLVVIDPLEQLSRGRDASRKSGVTQLGKAMQAYYTSQNRYPDINPTPNTAWHNALIDAGEIKALPQSPVYSMKAKCETADLYSWCYHHTQNQEAVVFARLESSSENTKCKDQASPRAFFVWSSANGRAGLVCRPGTLDPDEANEPRAGSQTFVE